MNSRCFKTVFSKRLGCLVAVGEHTASQGKANGAGEAGGAGLVRFVGLLAAGFAAVSLAWAQPASTALPTGGQVAQGAASIAQSGAVMNIQQSTPKAVLNWNSFDIGRDARVNIQQPGADAVMLNRVTGANPSQIFGQLSANGLVVLVNPNGVLFGKDGSVSASSFTASTLGISDANFMAGNMLFERNDSTAGVVNQGTIRATGGYVALLGASVNNEGRIETQGGAALLGAAETVKVPLGSSGRIKLELSPGAINAAVSNSKEGTIVTHGGQVYMQAAALRDAVASIVQSGDIDSTGGQGGAVHLLADGGQIKVDGRITANSTGKDDQQQTRKGGDIVIGRDEETGVLARTTDVSGARLQSQRALVETSGQWLRTDGVQVNAGEWLLDPFNVNIVSDATGASGDPYSSSFTATQASNIKASDISSSLSAGTSVTISTGIGTLDSQTTRATAGDIEVLAAITKTGTTTSKLTLDANNHIEVKAKITDSSTSTGALSLELIGRGLAKPFLVTNDVANSVYGGVFIASAGTGGDGTVNIKGDFIATGTNRISGLASGRDAGFRNDAPIVAKSISVTGDTSNPVSGGGIALRQAANLTATGGGINLNATGKAQHGLYSTTGLTATGNIVLTGNSTGSEGVWIDSNISSSAGTVSITGTSTQRGVLLTNAGQLLGTSVTITGTGTSSNGFSAGSNTKITATSGDLSITGTSTATTGLQTQGAVTAAQGNVVLIGTSTATTGAYGVYIFGASATLQSKVEATNGSLSITGTAAGSSAGVLVGRDLVSTNLAPIV